MQYWCIHESASWIGYPSDSSFVATTADPRADTPSPGTTFQALWLHYRLLVPRRNFHLHHSIPAIVACRGRCYNLLTRHAAHSIAFFAVCSRAPTCKTSIKYKRSSTRDFLPVIIFPYISILLTKGIDDQSRIGHRKHTQTFSGERSNFGRASILTGKHLAQSSKENTNAD